MGGVRPRRQLRPFAIGLTTMPRLGRGRRQLSSPLWRASVEDEVDAELAFHVEMRVRELVDEGETPERARQLAIALGLVARF